MSSRNFAQFCTDSHSEEKQSRMHSLRTETQNRINGIIDMIFGIKPLIVDTKRKEKEI